MGVMAIATGILAVLIGYLLGSIMSAYLIGRLKGVDMREVGDGHIGAAFAARKLGLASGIVVGLMDFGKGIMAVASAQILNVSLIFVLLAGLAAVTGHNWSIFLRFKGGKGAMTSYGVLASLVLWEFLVALALAGVFYLFTRRSALATGILFAILSVLLWAESMPQVLPQLALSREAQVSPLLALFPLSLLIPMLLKRPQKAIRSQMA